ncbi:MAG: permease [Pyrinomonadaceae bacterium]|nr:permease [Pyrinomonadaceae bacterium]
MTLLLVIVGALLVYKGTAALAVIEQVRNTGAGFQPRVNVLPVPGNSVQVNVIARSMNYFLVIWPALLFGILISGAVRVLVRPRWLAQALGAGQVRSHLVAGIAGAPLMLCSCCAAPVFSSVYERSSRLGPSLAFMLAAPSLNPAALILTFMLFDHRIAVTRIAMAGVAVFLTGILVEKLFSLRPIDCPTSDEESPRPVLTTFLRSCLQVAVRTVPLIAVGVLISMAIALWLPVGVFASSGGQRVAIIGVALIAVPLECLRSLRFRWL